MSAPMTDELYRQIILEHNKSPRNFRKPDPCTHEAEGYNPLCGDHLFVYLHLDDDQVRDIGFTGDGCAISRASASMMTQQLKGQPLRQAELICEEFLHMLKGEVKPEASQHLGKLKIFSGVAKFPSRIKCAALAWHAYRGALQEQRAVTTE